MQAGRFVETKKLILIKLENFMKTFTFIFYLSLLLIIVQRGLYAQHKKEFTDIKQIDFYNFTYSTPITKQFEWNKEVRVINGDFEEKHAEGQDGFYFGVKVLFEDINNDGKDEAVIIASCGRLLWNWGASEILVYGLNNGKPILLTSLDEKEIQSEYKKYFPNSVLWSIYDIRLSIIRNAPIEVDLYSDGSHASPKYLVSMHYYVQGDKINLMGAPERKSMSY